MTDVPISNRTKGQNDWGTEFDLAFPKSKIDIASTKVSGRKVKRHILGLDVRCKC